MHNTPTGERASCPSCGTLNIVPDYAGDFYGKHRHAPPVTLECYFCWEREELGRWEVNGYAIADTF